MSKNLLDIKKMKDEGCCTVCGTVEFYFDENNVACCEGCEIPLNSNFQNKKKKNKKVRKMKLHNE